MLPEETAVAPQEVLRVTCCNCSSKSNEYIFPSSHTSINLHSCPSRWYYVQIQYLFLFISFQVLTVTQANVTASSHEYHAQGSVVAQMMVARMNGI